MDTTEDRDLYAGIPATEDRSFYIWATHHEGAPKVWLDFMYGPPAGSDLDHLPTTQV